MRVQWLQPAGQRREWHVAGVVVYARLDAAEAVARAIDALPAAQVHASAQGKLVVTLEAARSGDLAEYMGLLQALPGVHGAAMVYQRHEDPTVLDEEVGDELDPSGIH